MIRPDRRPALRSAAADRAAGRAGLPGAKAAAGQGPARRFAAGAPVLTAALAGLLAAPAATAPLTLTLPAAAERTAETGLPDGIQLPVGPFRDGAVPRAEVRGQVIRQAYALPGTAATLDLTAPLRAQLEAAGWEILADCETMSCGGFDFRFALSVLPEPAMHVDLGDFRFLAARSGAQLVTVLASRRGTTGYLEITRALPAEPGAGPQETPDAAAPLPGGGVQTALPGGAGYRPGTLAQVLETLGHVVLDDLDFAIGSADLGSGSYGSLAELAAYLAANPNRRIALVGHTDATGGLEVNVTVSRRRAQSVLDRLASAHGVPRAVMSAAGAGYLAPRLSNLSEAGRSANRRVEVVLLSVD